MANSGGRVLGERAASGGKWKKVVFGAFLDLRSASRQCNGIKLANETL